jgi:hypothetical protein
MVSHCRRSVPGSVLLRKGQLRVRPTTPFYWGNPTNKKRSIQNMVSENNPFQPLFQRQLLATLIQAAETFSRYNGIWNHSYFDDPSHRMISQAYLKIRLLGNEHPTRASISKSCCVVMIITYLCP